jgi:hypothetical protein
MRQNGGSPSCCINATGTSNVDLLLMTESEFEKKRDWWTTPVYWAVRQGKVLYERT